MDLKKYGVYFFDARSFASALALLFVHTVTHLSMASGSAQRLHRLQFYLPCPSAQKDSEERFFISAKRTLPRMEMPMVESEHANKSHPQKLVVSLWFFDWKDHSHKTRTQF